MKLSEKMQEVRDLIADPNCWTQGDHAKDAQGYQVMFDSSEAVCWCSIGAIFRVLTGDMESGDFSARVLIRQHLNENMGHYIAGFNDSNEHSVVIAAWDAAIADAKKDEEGV